MILIKCFSIDNEIRNCAVGNLPQLNAVYTVLSIFIPHVSLSEQISHVQEKPDALFRVHECIFVFLRVLSESTLSILIFF